MTCTSLADGMSSACNHVHGGVRILPATLACTTEVINDGPQTLRPDLWTSQSLCDTWKGLINGVLALRPVKNGAAPCDQCGSSADPAGHYSAGLIV